MPIDIAALFAILAPYYLLLCKFSENRKKIAPFGCIEREEGNDEDLQKEVQAFEKEVTESLHKCLCDECHEKNDPNYTAEECSLHNSDNVDFRWEMIPMKNGIVLTPFDGGFMRGYSAFFVVTKGLKAGKMFLLQTPLWSVFDGVEYMDVDWEKASNADVLTLMYRNISECRRQDRSNDVPTYECSFLGRVERGV